MGYIITLIFLALAISLFLSLVRSGRFVRWARLFRIATVAVTVAVFSYWFFERSVTRFVENSMAVQLINKLPQPIDFYILKKDSQTDEPSRFVTSHLGNIRPDYFRIAYLDMKTSDEFWIVGYLGKKNLVYFSQHAVPNKNMDQIIEVQNYINQSQKLSDIAKKDISAYQSSNMYLGIWVSLCFLLLFMNIVLLLRRRKLAV